MTAPTLELNRCVFGDALKVLRTLPDGVFDACITSPPYFHLRRYSDDKAEIGQEPTIRQYVSRLVRVFRQVRRTLRPDGTLWLVIADSRANDSKWGGRTGGKHAAALHGSTGIGRDKLTTGLPEKSLMGIPWRVALALQADGWVLRSSIIWDRPNAMPESVSDRVTDSHEYVFMLSRSSSYYFNGDAISEPVVRGYAGSRFDVGKTAQHQLGRMSQRERKESDTRHARSVWSIPTEAFPGAHFATFPQALVRRCMLAGSRADGAVLDVFMGSGTVARVAEDLGRQWLGIELNADYLPLIAQRTAQTAMAFREPAPARPEPEQCDLEVGNA